MRCPKWSVLRVARDPPAAEERAAGRCTTRRLPAHVGSLDGVSPEECLTLPGGREIAPSGSRDSGEALGSWAFRASPALGTVLTQFPSFRWDFIKFV